MMSSIPLLQAVQGTRLAPVRQEPSSLLRGPKLASFTNSTEPRCRRRVTSAGATIHPDGRPTPHTSDNADLRARRRNIVVALPAAYVLQAAMQSCAADVQTKAFDNNGISFNYPGNWLKAYDRTSTGSVGGLVLVGDFQYVDTVSVVSSPIDEDLQGLEGGTLGAREAAEIILKEPLTSTSTMSLDILNTTVSDSHGPKPAYCIEYVLDICRGTREEGIGGELRCMGQQGELQTVKRHHLAVATVRDGLVYTLSASAEESRWSIVSEQLQAASESFLLAA